jgi:hypothetical protein
MKNEKAKMEFVHFVQFLDACGGEKNHSSLFNSFVFSLFSAEGVYKFVRRTQLPFSKEEKGDKQIGYLFCSKFYIFCPFCYSIR